MSKIFCKSGDVVTALRTGDLRMTFGQGKAAREIPMNAGEAVHITEPTKIEGIPVYINRAKISRVVAKRMMRNQADRTCSLSIASLEVPTMEDSRVREIEDQLAQRSAELKRRLLKEADRLKNG